MDRLRTTEYRGKVKLCDLEKFEGPNRGYERVHKWISGAPVYLWKSDNYEMFYR